jgi:hypothetical protein
VAPLSVSKAVVEAYWRRVNAVIGSGERAALAVRAARAETLVRAFYVYLMMASYNRFLEQFDALVVDKPVLPRLQLALTSWIPLDVWREVALGFGFLLLVASLLAAAAPRRRIPRIMTIVLFVLLEAMTFDLEGKISHAAHPVVWVGIAFCFLPSLRNDSSERRREYLAIFFGAQVLVCLLYSCAGFSKLIGIAYDWHEGVTWLNPEALPLLLAAKWQRSLVYPTAPFFFSTPWASWLSSIGVLFLELGTLFAVFRARLHRPWAFGLLTMHAVILLTMRIAFRPSVLVVGFILLASPFAPTRLEFKETLLDLPGVRFVHRWLSNRSRARTDGDDQMETREDVPWIPSSKVLKLWVPVLVLMYVCVAYATLDNRGRSDQELYPISAMPMFMRINSGKENTVKLTRIRKSVDRAKERNAN